LISNTSIPIIPAFTEPPEIRLQNIPTYGFELEKDVIRRAEQERKDELGWRESESRKHSANPLNTGQQGTNYSDATQDRDRNADTATQVENLRTQFETLPIMGATNPHSDLTRPTDNYRNSRVSS